MNAQLFPREPRRMKQPAKDALRDAAQQATEQLRAALATN